MNNFPFTMQDICTLEGISIPPDGRAEYETVCPMCGKRSLNINFQKGCFQCWSCESSGGLLAFYLFCEGKENLSLKEARKEVMSRLYGTTPSEHEERAKKIQARRNEIKASEVKQCSLRTVEERNLTYSALLDMLSLAEDHHMDLSKKRGLSDFTITLRKYKSFPVSSFEEYPLKLMEMGLYVDGIPGFYKTEKGVWSLRGFKRGIIIPILNRNGLIQGFQIRKDDSLLKTFYKKDAKGNYLLDSNKMQIVDKEKKYGWLSTKGLSFGTPTNSYIHYAADFVMDHGSLVPKLTPDKGILLTEGPLKGDIFFEKTGYPAICVPGVNCILPLETELKFLKELGFKKVYQAYDMDYLTNKNVAKYLAKSYDIIKNQGFEVVRLQWNPKYKGIDDYYLAKERGEV